MREPSRHAARDAPSAPESALHSTWARLLVVVVGLAAVAFVVAKRAGLGAPAQERPPVGALGAQLLDADLLDEDGAVTRFRLNGVAVSAIGGRSDAPLDAVLGEVSARCADDVPIDPEALAAGLSVPREGASGIAPSGLASGAIAGEHGFVTCLDRFAEPPARGSMRYVYARRMPEGSTRFVVVSTDVPVGPSELARLEPSGDVAGEDVPALPLPSGARRRWSFAREDGRDRVVVYAVEEDASAIERWASEALPHAGWSAPVASGGEGAARVLSARRGGQHLYLVLRDDRTLVAIATRTPRGYGLPQSPSP